MKNKQKVAKLKKKLAEAEKKGDLREIAKFAKKISELQALIINPLSIF